MKRAVTGGLALILFLVSFSCEEKQKTTGGPPQRAALQVEGVVVVPQRFENKYLTTANILPFEEVELRAPVSGTVLSINFKEAGRVKEGQPLLRIDDRSWKSQIKALQVQLKAAQSELKRNLELLDVEGVSQEEVELSQAQVDGLKAQIEGLRVNIGLANVTAPFSGRVGLRNFSIGSYMTQGQSITTLVQTDKLKVDFDIASRYLNEVRPGTTVDVMSSGDTLKASVYAISPVINQDSRTAQVRALIENNSKGFIPGDFAEVELSLNIDNEALVVPTDVIISELNAQTVYLYRNGRAERREVLLGPRTAEVVQVLSGLQAGDTVLTTGLIQVRDMIPVELINVHREVTP